MKLSFLISLSLCFVKYNFLLGVSHPYTTVDVQAKAELGKSDDKLTAGIDIKYMNARRQTKNFALMTEIDRLRPARYIL
jgi:hypothetical protein